MPQLTPSRLVTVSVQGRNRRQLRTASERLRLVIKVARVVDQRWRRVDAVVFPGGFLRLRKPLGHLDHDDRVRGLEAAALIKPLKQAAEQLRNSPGALIVVGIDGKRRPNGECRDQFCVAVSAGGVAGIGRKIFPVAGREAHALVCYEADFAGTQRVVRLASGSEAVLLACYDVFGFAERGGPGAHARTIRRLGPDRLERGDPKFDARLASNLKMLAQGLDGVCVGLAAVHRFDNSTTGYWQRHGIATLSAALGGGVVVGASHFGALPRSPSSSPLAAVGVPAEHLGQGLHRRAHSWAPDDAVVLPAKPFPALLRLFCS